MSKDQENKQSQQSQPSNIIGPVSRLLERYQRKGDNIEVIKNYFDQIDQTIKLNSRGDTLLHIVVSNASTNFSGRGVDTLGVLKYLIEKKYDTNVLNNDNKTPIDIASEGGLGHKKALEFLENYAKTISNSSNSPVAATSSSQQQSGNQTISNSINSPVSTTSSSQQKSSQVKTGLSAEEVKNQSNEGRGGGGNNL